MEPHHSRPSRLEKQEEFEEEEENFMLSPVTIQIEDRGGIPEEETETKVPSCAFGADDDSSTGKADSNPDLSPDSLEKMAEMKPERRRSSGRLKLLVRSHAVHDDASPPPDLETVITNTNMLSVTTASTFATQSKGSKIRLGGSSSQGSTESSSASGLSRDSSTEYYTDSSGIDLQQFIVDTLHKNQKDRLTLLKVEQELTLFVKDNKRQSMKFPQMSSYNRMLVHRVAAFFGLDHYVDGNGTSVIVNKTKTTRTPDSRFQDFIRDELLPEEPRKSILKRDSSSFEEGKESKSPERQSSTDSRRSKSFEEREEEYEKARARIFNQDEGLGESPINRSQEGTHCSSRRSSQEDIRWPSSETRPWSSTDSDSSGRPLGSKLSSSFETDAPAQNKARCFVTPVKVEKVDIETRTLLVASKPNRPLMKKASSFGGISVLSREDSCSRNKTPKITKAESFNVTTISSSSALPPDVSSITLEACSSESTITSFTTVTVTQLSQTVHASALISSEQTFPLIAIQPADMHIPLVQDFTQPVTEKKGTKEDAKDFLSTSVIGQPLTWPYSTGTDILFPSVFVNPQSGYPRLAFPCQSLPISSTDQAPTSIGLVSSGVTSSTQSSQRPQSSSLSLQSQQSQPTVNTSSPNVLYLPYVPQISSSASIAPVQNIRHQVQPHMSQFVAEPRPLVLFPVCYLQHTPNTKPVRHAFTTTITTTMQTPCQSLSSGLHASNVPDVKGNSSSNLLSTPYMQCFSALACTQGAETSLVTTTSATMYPYGNINIGNLCQSTHKPYTSQKVQTPAGIQQSFVQLQTPSSTLPPVYVSITSSTQTPAVRTHSGGHVAAQFSSSRSQSLPVSLSSSMLNQSLNPVGPFLGYTVYAPQMQSVPTPSQLTTVTISQNTATVQPSQFAPAYVPAFQMLPQNIPIVASIGSPATGASNVLRAQYPSAISSITKESLNFPLVKQASDPGVGEHATAASATKLVEWVRFRGNCLNDLCVVGPNLQPHIGPLLLPQQPTISRFPRASIPHHSPATRPPKTRKHRSKGNTSSVTHATPTIFEGEGKRIYKVVGLPEDIKRIDVERYLESVIEIGAKIHLLNAENLKVVDEGNDFIISSDKHIVLATFDSDTAAEKALISIQTTKFDLRLWCYTEDSKNLKKS